MTHRIQLQAGRVWQSLSSPETRQTYQSAGAATWTILKESGLLLWLVACLVLVMLDWGTGAAIAAGRSSREAIAQVGRIEPDAAIANTKQSLLSAGRNGVTGALAQARAQIGLPQKSETVAEATAPLPEAASSAVPAAPDAPSDKAPGAPNVASVEATGEDAAVAASSASAIAKPEPATSAPQDK